MAEKELKRMSDTPMKSRTGECVSSEKYLICSVYVSKRVDVSVRDDS
jgi:hypothetical protein